MLTSAQTLERHSVAYLAWESVLRGRISSVQEQLVYALLCQRRVLAHARVPSHVTSVQNCLHIKLCSNCHV